MLRNAVGDVRNEAVMDFERIIKYLLRSLRGLEKTRVLVFNLIFA